MGATADVLKPDLCVIGAGAAGLQVATAAAAFGVAVVLVERDMNARTDLLAKEALLTVANRAQMVRESSRLGIVGSEPVIDFAGVATYVRRATAAARVNAAAGRLSALGVRVIEGEARFINRSAVTVAGQEIRARRFVVATGSAPVLPAIDGIEAIEPLTEDSIGAMAKLPARLVVVSDGRSGLDLAQGFARLGTSVTLLCSGPLLPEEEPEAVALLRRALLRDGVALREQVTIALIRSVRGGSALELRDGTTIETDRLMMAAGRAPETATLDLEMAGIVAGKDGIAVDRGMRTANRRVFAIGSCVVGFDRSLQAAQHQAGIVLRRALFRLPAKVAPGTVPRVTGCSPELAAVGLTEAQARNAGGTLTVLRWPFSENERARASGETEGFVKLVTDRKGRLRGATVIGARASELITPWSVALRQGLRVGDMAGASTPWPSLSGAGQQAALSSFTPLAARPSVRRLIAFLRRLG